MALASGLLAAGAAHGIAPPVLRMVVLGDSFTSTMDALELRDDPSISWVTGTRLATPSVVQRLAAEGWDVRGANMATSGHRARDIAGQLDRAPPRADLVIVWIGINDLCTPGLDATSFQQQVRDAFGAVEAKYPDAKVLVFAPPSLTHIGRQHAAFPQAVRLWSEAGLCGTFFGDSRSHGAGADRQARFDAAIERAAAENGFHYSRALYTFNRPLAEWTAWDYLHPSPRGSAMFAARAWPDVLNVAGRPADA